jgi:N-acetylmuramoyl-L-alanine amidase
MRIEKIVIHCTDTFADMDIGVDEIRQWHLERGFSDVGYHYVIRRDGAVEQGREETTPGAHVRGHNANSLGVAMVGGKARGDESPVNFTSAQWGALDRLISKLKAVHRAEVVGHCDLDSGKTCPNFNVTAWAGTI